VGQLASHQPGSNADTLTWDALGRLVAMQRNPSGNGFVWSAVYDGLGRRLQTSQQTLSGGALSGTPLVIQSSYDPDVEFMELAVTVVGGVRNWLVHGPDLSGVYGGLQGTGGIEAVVNGSSKVATGIISDVYGHTGATVTGGNTVTWNGVRSSGYGPQPGTAALPVDATHDVSTVLAWRGHYVDGTGLYYLGARYYDPQSGTFISADPMGHAASMSLYDYANGDPVNGFDPDGRFGTQMASATNSWVAATDDVALNAVIGGAALLSYGMDWGVTALQGDGFTGGGTHLADQGNALTQAMNPMMQSGYYQSGSIYAQARSAAELTLGAYGLASSLPRLGSSLASLGDSFGSWGRSTSTTLSGLTQDLSFAYENTALSSETGTLQLGNVNLAAPAVAETTATRQAIAYNFYKSAGWSDAKILNHLQGIDFTQPVDVISIPQDTRVVQYQIPGAPVGNYFAPVGTPANTLGIYTSGLVGNVYTATEPITVLRSTSASITDTWSMQRAGWQIQTQGGSIQFFAPNQGGFK